MLISKQNSREVEFSTKDERIIRTSNVHLKDPVKTSCPPYNGTKRTVNFYKTYINNFTIEGVTEFDVNRLIEEYFMSLSLRIQKR